MKLSNNILVFEIKGLNFSMWYLLLGFFICCILGLAVDELIVNRIFSEDLNWTRRQRVGLIISILCVGFLLIVRRKHKLLYDKETQIFTYYLGYKEILQFHLNDIVKVRSNPITICKPAYMVIHLQNNRKKYLYFLAFNFFNNLSDNPSKENIFKFLKTLIHDLNFKMNQPYLDRGNKKFAEYINTNIN